MMTNTKLLAEKLSYLADLLEANRGKIMWTNECLNNPTSHCNLFAKEGEYQHRLQIQQMARKRLIERWNKLIQTEIK